MSDRIIFYDVKPGDTPDSIAKKHGVTWKAILELPYNATLKFTGLKVGNRISIPVSYTGVYTGPKTNAKGPFRKSIPSQKEFHASLLKSRPGTFFELKIIVLLHLKEMSPTSGQANLGGRTLAVTKWSKGEFTTFKAQVKEGVEKFWNKRFRLWPPDDYTQITTGIDCSVEVQYVPGEAGASKVVKCYKRAPGEVSMSQTSSEWTSAILLDGDPRLKNKDGRTVATVSKTLAHEFGHLLGLLHPVCEGDELACYGDGAEDWQIMNVMGGGDRVAPMNARPWIERAEMHTGVSQSDWTVYILDEMSNPLYL
jgi:LysM repeat protein